MGNTARGAARQPIETDDPTRSRSGTKRPPADRSHPVSPAHGRRGVARPSVSRTLLRACGARRPNGDRKTERRQSEGEHRAGSNPPSDRNRRPRPLALGNETAAGRPESPRLAGPRPARAGAASRGRRARRLSFGPAEHGDRTAIGRPNAGSPKGSTAPETARRPVEPGDPTGRSRSGRDRRRPTGRTPPRRRVGPPGQARCRVIVGLADSFSGRAEHGDRMVARCAGNREEEGRTAPALGIRNRRPHPLALRNERPRDRADSRRTAGAPAELRRRSVAWSPVSPTLPRSYGTRRPNGDRRTGQRESDGEHGVGNRPSAGRTRQNHPAFATRKGPSAADRRHAASPGAIEGRPPLPALPAGGADAAPERRRHRDPSAAERSPAGPRDSAAAPTRSRRE